MSHNKADVIHLVCDGHVTGGGTQAQLPAMCTCTHRDAVQGELIVDIPLGVWGQSGSPPRTHNPVSMQVECRREKQPKPVPLSRYRNGFGWLVKCHNLA